MNTKTETTSTTKFVNLFKAIKAEQAKRMQDFISSVNSESSMETFTNRYGMYGDLIPASRKGYLWTLEAIREYLIARKLKANEKDLQKKLAHLQAVEQAPDMVSVNISVEWKRSRMWGNNPRAAARVCYTDHSCNTFESGSIGGCGYDKESTAIAEALNQSNSFLKALYQIKEHGATEKNHDIFGYGSGYGILPRLEGGVGVSCYPKIFKTIGFEWSNAGSGKAFDVYTVTK